MHWDYGRQLEAAGVYQLTNVVELPGGMYKARIQCAGFVKEDKTFFPSHWDAETLLSKINEACHNIKDIKYKDDGTIVIVGAIKEGFEIVVKIGKNGCIETIYPKSL